MNNKTLLRGLLLLAISAAALSAPHPASAQLTRTDSSAVLLATAEDFANRGADDIAEALYRHILEHYPETDAAEAARTRLEVVTDRQSQNGGEVEIKVWSATYGLLHGGVLVPMAAGSTEPEAVGAGLLLGGPAGFLLGFKLTESRPYSPGQARALTWGGTWGTIQGAMFADLADLGESEYDNASSEATAGSMIVGGALGVAGGAILSRREIAAGTGTSAMLGSLWGLWFGAASSVLMDIDDGDGLIGMMMLTGNAGLIGGAIAGSRVPISRGRARLISLGGLLGGFAGLGVVLMGTPDSEKVVIGIPLVTSIAGLALGTVVTRGRDWADRSDDVRAAATLTPPGTLVNWSEGNWALSTPLPTPALQPTPQNGGRDGLTWKVPLLRVRF